MRGDELTSACVEFVAILARGVEAKAEAEEGITRFAQGEGGPDELATTSRALAEALAALTPASNALSEQVGRVPTDLFARLVSAMAEAQQEQAKVESALAAPAAGRPS